MLQGAIVVAGVLLAFVFGLRPWHDIEVSPRVLAWSVFATAPLILLLALLGTDRWSWLREITRLIEQLIVPLFAHAPAGSVLLVSILAGVGEELLFRGVIQAGLEGPLGPLAALVVASVLFGMAHAITPAYFVLATFMGAYLGLLYHYTGNLFVVVVVHALYDWIAIRYYLWRHGQVPNGSFRS